MNNSKNTVADSNQTCSSDLFSFIDQFKNADDDVHVECESVEEIEKKIGIDPFTISRNEESHENIIEYDEESDSEMQKQNEMEDVETEEEEERKGKNHKMERLLCKLNQKWVENNKNSNENKYSTKKHSNPRRKLKEELRRTVSKCRSHHMRMHRKKFGKKDEYYIRDKRMKDDDDIRMAKEEEEKEEENEEEMEENVIVNDDKEMEEMMVEEEEPLIMSKKEMSDLDFEALAQMHERQTANEIPKEILQYLDVTAEEENENGTIMDHSDDEHYETFGVVKDLLATKHDCYMDDSIEHENKRKKIHQKLIEMEDQQNLELMQTAFIDGKYREIQALHKKQYRLQQQQTMNDNNYSSSLNGFQSRNSEWSLKRPEDYLTIDTALNEYCVYDKNGEFNDVFTIRMKMNEWKRRMIHTTTHDDDDNDDDESLINHKNIKNVNSTLVSTLDTESIDILRNIRQNNHKNRKRNKKESESTDFSNFFKENTIIPKINRQNSSSFLESHCKQIKRDRKMINSTDSIFSSNSNHSSNHFLFSSLSNANQNKKKRKLHN